MSCTERETTRALLDGQLDGAAAKDAALHLEGCAACAMLRDESERMSLALRQQRYRAPVQLRTRIANAIAEETQNVVLLRGSKRGFWQGALSGAFATALAAGFALFLILPPSAATLADAVTEAHSQALVSGHAIVVASSDHHTVKPWFATHVDISPPVVDFRDAGFPLAGGRVDKIAGQHAAVVVYRHGKHAIDLFVWADRGSPLPGDGMRHGYHTTFWKQGDLDFAAVSDMEEVELAKFVTLVRSARE